MKPSAMLIATGASVFGAHAAAQDLPKMKAGLWESSTTNSGPKGSPGSSFTHTVCMNDAVQKDIFAFSQNMGAQCKNSAMRKDGNKYYGEAECVMGSMTVKSTSVTTFNSDTSYRSESKATFSPAMAGMTDSTTLSESKFVGPCPANMKPGEINMNGRVTNINDMGKMLKGIKK
jgi:hypothetical protein